MRLSDEAMQRTPIASLVRLAVAMGIDVTRGDESDGAYRHRVRIAIQRREAEQARGLP